MIASLRALLALVLIVSIGGATAHGEASTECADENVGCCAKAEAPELGAGVGSDAHALTDPGGASSLDPGDCGPLCASCSRPPTATMPAAVTHASRLAATLPTSMMIDDGAPVAPPSHGVFRPPRA